MKFFLSFLKYYYSRLVEKEFCSPSGFTSDQPNLSRGGYKSLPKDTANIETNHGMLSERCVAHAVWLERDADNSTY